MRNVNVPLSDEDLELLRKLAQQELRDPRSQAAVLIREALRRSASPGTRRGGAPMSDRLAAAVRR